MFLVFNKQKIITYFVSFFTVIVLFFVASTINDNSKTVETLSVNERLLPIYNVKTDEEKVAFTMNCAWNGDDIDSILLDLPINTVLKEKISSIMFSDLPLKKKRIEIRKLRKFNLTSEYIRLFLRLLEYISQI